MAQAAEMTSMNDTLWLTFSLMGIIIIIFGAFYFTKWFSKKIPAVNGSKIKILDRAVIGQNEYIVVAKVGEKVFLLGVSGQSVNLIAELDPEEYKDENSENIKPFPDFGSYMRSAKELTQKIGRNKNDGSN